MSFVIHIGLPKSGSSFLQEIFKNQLKEFIFLGKNYNDENIKKIIKYCIDDTIYDTINSKKFFLNFDPNKKYLISDEKFLNKTVTDLGTCLTKLEKIFKPKILIILRNQVDFLYSALRNNNFTYYGSKFSINANFEDIINISLDDTKPKHHFFRFLNFNSFIEHLYKIFSKENVKILFYEDLLYNNEFFFNELNNFLREKLVNKKLEVNKTSFFKKILYRKNKNICEKIFEYYYKENYELNEKIKLPEQYLKI